MGFTFDGGRYDRESIPEVQPVDITDILAQSRERYVINTSKGTVVMKHITKRMKDRLDAIKYTLYPNVRELEEEASILLPMAMAEGCDEATKERANVIATQLAPILDIYALGCIEYPFLSTRDDLDVLIQSLAIEEQEAVRQLLTVLTDWSAPIDFTKLEMAERFRIQVVTMEHIQEPTYMQYLALKAVIEQEHRQTEKLYRDMGALK